MSHRISINITKTEQVLCLYHKRIPILVRNLLFEFFSNLNQGTISLENAQIPIKIEKILEGTEFSNVVRMNNAKNTHIILKVQNKSILVFFKSYWENDEVLYHEITITSDDKFNFEDYSFFEYLLDNAIYYSDFKGAYINVEDDDFQNFYKHELPERSFNDIFLPQSILKDLQAYDAIFEKRKRLLRYLFVGVPGSGKTESLIVLANMLKQKGVTILKASAAAIRNAVKFANILAPSLIILDDVDLELGNRDNYSQTSYLRTFLDVLDGVEKINPDVGIIATTNSLWLVDTAAQRPGRFNKILFFGDLTAENIINIIQKALKNLNMENLKTLYAHEIVENYRENKFTGAYIYNMTQMLANQIDIGAIKEEIQDILAYIEEDVDTLNRLRKSQSGHG
ncbi:MAG: ATP-binding protein [Microscillaceae bacterium]|nr:ATP-binding protein [Microscillaceae bacterium]MDW8460088.1 ATP-binding protein [Cytophagales bacterium]